MAITLTSINGSKPGDLLHFWDALVTLDADTIGPWIATGFEVSPESGGSGAVTALAPQFLHAFTVNGTNIAYVGEYIVELNSAPVVATKPGYTNPLNGQVVPTTTVTVPAGGAFRIVKSAVLDSNGAIRVAVGFLPGNLTNN